MRENPKRDLRIQRDRKSACFDADMPDNERIGNGLSCVGEHAVHPIELVSRTAPTWFCPRHAVEPQQGRMRMVMLDAMVVDVLIGVLIGSILISSYRLGCRDADEKRVLNHAKHSRHPSPFFDASSKRWRCPCEAFRPTAKESGDA